MIRDDAIQYAPVLGFVSLVVTIMVVGLCACFKGSSADEDDAEKNNKVKSRGKKSKKNQSRHTSLEVDGDGRNGTVCVGNGDRPKSGNDRALPEIPGDHPGAGYEDEEDESDGLYDVINKRDKAGKAKDQQIITHQSIPGQNPYELMPGDMDSDTTPVGSAEASVSYSASAKVKRDSSRTDTSYAGTPVTKPSTGSRTDNVKDVYSVPQRKARNPYETVHDTSASSHLVENSSKMSTRDSLRDDTLNDSTSTAPPIPVKNFNDSQVVSSHDVSPNAGRTMTTADVSVTSQSIQIDTAVVPLGPEMAMMINGPVLVNQAGLNDTPSDPGVKREPPYSKVTARESLNHIRLRQAAEVNMNMHSPRLVISPNTGNDTDVDYDQINYDQIKSTEGASGGVDTGSELYAEIGGSEAQTTQDTTYAAVEDVDVTFHAPTPPPVDTLKQITEIGGLDPGYSRIGGSTSSRPHSTTSASSKTHKEVLVDEEGTPLYAEVDKSKKAKNRHTVNNLDTEELELMYAKVNKERKIDNGGARPKVMQTPKTNSVTSSFNGETPDPGYSTVNTIVAIHHRPKRQNSDYYDINIDDLPGNQGNNEMDSEYDPNYESVGSLNKQHLSSNRDSSSIENGVAREIVSHGGGAAIVGENELGMVHVKYNDKNTQSVWDKPGLTREHIYQEIHETKRHSKRKSREDKELKKSISKGTNQKDSSNSKKL